MEEGGEGLLLVAGEVPDDQGCADTMIENGRGVLVLVEIAITDAAGAVDLGEALHFGGGEILEEPGGELGGENFEIFAHLGSEAAEAALVAGGEVEHFVGLAEKFGFVRGGLDDFSFGDFVVGGIFGGVGGLGRFAAGDERSGVLGRLFVGNGNGGFLAGRALVDLDPVLVEPEFDFFVAILIFGRHLEDVDVDLAAAIEVADDGVGDLGDHAAADVAFDAVFVFVHEEKGVGLVEILVEALVDFGLALGVIVVARGEPTAEREARGGLGFVGSFGFGRDRAGPVDDFVAAAFEVTTPVEGTLVELRAAGDNEFFHDLTSSESMIIGKRSRMGMRRRGKLSKNLPQLR